MEEKHSQEFTHLDKILWPDEGYTKEDLINYYEKIGNTILPYLKDRPNSLYRTPSGIEGVHFYQKNVHEENLPDFVKTKIIHTKTTDEDVHYIICNNEETLLYMANIGCIEIHTWHSRVNTLEKPDYIIFDIDRGEESSFDDVVTVARTIHKILDDINVSNFCKTSGKNGLHIYVPIENKYSYDEVRHFADLVSRKVNKEIPEITSLEHFPDKRKNKIHIDISRNAIGQTVITPYSLRAIAGASVSTPLEWYEVRAGLNPNKFNIKTIFKRLEQKGDLWKQVIDPSISSRVDLNKVVNFI